MDKCQFNHIGPCMHAVMNPDDDIDMANKAKRINIVPRVAASAEIKPKSSTTGKYPVTHSDLIETKKELQEWRNKFQQGKTGENQNKNDNIYENKMYANTSKYGKKDENESSSSSSKGKSKSKSKHRKIGQSPKKLLRRRGGHSERNGKNGKNGNKGRNAFGTGKQQDVSVNTNDLPREEQKLPSEEMPDVSSPADTWIKSKKIT